MMTADPACADANPGVSERGLWWLRVFPGVSVQVAEARQFVAFLLDGCPARDALVSCVSELAANAVIHTASGNGGFFTVEVSYPRTGLARVSVTDEGGPTEPAAGAPVTDGPATARSTTCRPAAWGSPWSPGPPAAGAIPTSARPHGVGRGFLACPGRQRDSRSSRQPWYTAKHGWRDGGGAA